MVVLQQPVAALYVRRRPRARRLFVDVLIDYYLSNMLIPDPSCVFSLPHHPTSYDNISYDNHI
jgi:hypothetical protein